MDKREHVSKIRNLMNYARWVIVAILLLVLIVAIIGFLLKWGGLALHPSRIIDSYHDITNDIFSILVMYEIFDLLYTLSPTRLMDIVLLTIARKVVLSPESTGLIQSVIAFVLLLVARLLWDRFSNKRSNT